MCPMCNKFVLSVTFLALIWLSGAHGMVVPINFGENIRTESLSKTKKLNPYLTDIQSRIGKDTAEKMIDSDQDDVEGELKMSKVCQDISILKRFTTIDLKNSMECFDKTKQLILNPSTELLTELPELNKMALFELANRLRGIKGDDFRLINSESQLQKGPCLDFDIAANGINWGFQLGQDYSKYTQSSTAELASFVYCFFICLGYKLCELDSPISIEDLQILITRIVDNAPENNELLEIARLIKDTVMSL